MSDCNVVPVERGQYQCTITPPWFVEGSEYKALDGNFRLLINGEEAFRAVHEAIKGATKSVCIVCWGFQPSMYFLRDGKEPSIGKLLQQKAKEKVNVRVLCWAFRAAEVLPGRPLNITGPAVDEANTPGRGDWINRWGDKPPTSTDAQYKYDVEWYGKFDEDQEPEDVKWKKTRETFGNTERQNLHFHDRGFTNGDRIGIARQNYEDKKVSTTTKAVLSAAPSHHQKMVLVDYELPDKAIGFVMGHNMLDEYWDTSEHSAKRRVLLKTGKPDPNPNTGPNGKIPRHDFSSRLTGPIVGDLFQNFAQAWEKRTTERAFEGEGTPEKLTPVDFKNYPARCDSDGLYIKGQILRTHAQYGKQDIMKCYLQAVNNASQYIHIENQYFRWPPLAEKIKACAVGQGACGRKPETHGPLYLFVITNSSDEGVGAGTVNTFRMLDSLGRADAIPEVARDQRVRDIDAELGKAKNQTQALKNQKTDLDIQADQLRGATGSAASLTKRYEALNAKLDAAKAREKALQDQKATTQDKKTVILPEERPGLKFHVCTLVAPDTQDGEAWIEVYIHAKLMLIDDAFMTLGSTNINTRSMQVDSELNIAHHRPEITQPARRKLWELHTNGQGAQDDPGEAFKWWGTIMKKNKDCRSEKKKPIASLAEFRRDSADRTDKD